ncbi:hypothetical protein [Chryseobacterium sp. 18068]|uniref:hypothetical protein n=1 Tax=Chryseobacterium sp. 18068 TaxID=2681414 RepID=UPI00135C5D2E|nr:hypothetical protein [Chryseobacterium sp. 18068]
MDLNELDKQILKAQQESNNKINKLKEKKRKHEENMRNDLINRVFGKNWLNFYQSIVKDEEVKIEILVNDIKFSLEDQKKDEAQ